MKTRNRTSRYHLAIDLAQKAYQQGDISQAEYRQVETIMKQKLQAHHEYIIKHGTDPDEIKEWRLA